jgi:hypothetical protein
MWIVCARNVGFSFPKNKSEAYFRANFYLMEFETDAKAILSLIMESLFNRTLVGIYAPRVLGAGTFITTVEMIALAECGLSIHLKEYDSTGYVLPQNRLKLRDITRICSFASSMENPYLRQLTGDRFYKIIN